VLDFVEKPKGDRKTSKSLLMAFVEDPNQKTLWKTKIRRLQLKLQTGRATIMSDDDSSGLSSTDAVLLKVIKQEQEVCVSLSLDLSLLVKKETERSPQSKQKTAPATRRVISIEEAKSLKTPSSSSD